VAEHAPYAKRVANDGIQLRNGPSSHPDFPRSAVYSGPVTLYPGDLGWEQWNNDLGELDELPAEDAPF
jgi:hypothetical protein